MPKAINLDEQHVIELYAKYDNCRQVAEALGVSNEKVRRVLKKHGVSRTGNRVVERRHHPAKCAYRDNCYALFRMLYDVLGINAQGIATALGVDQSTVWNACCKSRGIWGRPNKQDFDLAQIEHEYLNGATTYELSEKYGVRHETISRWMRQLGHCRGKGYAGKKGFAAANNKNHEAAQERFEEWLSSKYEGLYSLVEGAEGHRCKDTIRCNKCGTVFKRLRNTKYGIRCPTCYELSVRENQEAKAERDRQQKKLREQEREIQNQIEFAKDKTCVKCGAIFHSEYKSAKYCSNGCSKGSQRKRERERLHVRGEVSYDHGSHRKRARKYGVEYVPGITLRSLIKRDGLTCRICGEPCDPKDRHENHVGKNYPTIDHIIPMKNGGGHTWDNVQIAHMVCNSTKQDRELTDDLREQIIERKASTSSKDQQSQRNSRCSTRGSMAVSQ